MEIKIGDIVRFKSEYLKKIGENHSRMALMRGYVQQIRQTGPASLADVRWENHGVLPAKIDSLEKVTKH